MLAELEQAWAELDADPDVRVIVNTGNGAAFQTGLDVAQLSRDHDALREQSRRTKRAELQLTAWHNRVWKPVIAAVNGVCAGGGLHFVADADIVIAADRRHASSIPTCRSARSPPTRPSRCPQVADGADHAHGAGRPPRAHRPPSGPTSSASSAQVVDPPERCATRPQALAEKIARNSPAAMAATKRALWGALERASPTPAGPGPASSWRCGATPTRPRARWPSPRERRELGMPAAAVRHRPRPAPIDRMLDTRRAYSTYEHLIVERRGPVGWLINNRPDQLNAMNSAHARRVRRSRGTSSTPTPRCG